MLTILNTHVDSECSMVRCRIKKMGHEMYTYGTVHVKILLRPKTKPGAYYK